MEAVAENITKTTSEVPFYTRVADIKRLQFIIDDLKANIPSDGDVLDVGCGNGIISLNLGKEGFNVHGIDVSDKAIATAQAKNDFNNVNFEVLSAEGLQNNGKLYDAIVCSEVLEHLAKPEGLLSVLYHKLKENGRLIITVPNGKGPREVLVTKPTLRMSKSNNSFYKMMLKVKGALGYDGSTVQSNADNLDHVQFFSKKDLNTLSSQYAMEIVKFHHANFVDDVFPFSMITRKINFLQKFDARVADVLPSALVGGFMTVWKKKSEK